MSESEEAGGPDPNAVVTPPDSEAELDDHGLARLEPVDPREIWSSEPGDFTPWLADNIDVLFDQLGIDVGEVAEIQTEVPVGPFKLDILVETTGGMRVAVENQLATSDHSHLGQLLLYAAGLDANVLVWIATRFRPEYRAALDWLNSQTLAGTHVFGVALRLVSIGASPPAPIFDVISEPNDWEESTRARSQPTDVNRQRQTFYGEALELLADRLTAFRMPKSQAESWQTFKSGPFGNYAFVFTGDGRLRVELYLDAAEPETLAKQLFDDLHMDASAIQESVGAELTWERLDGKRASRLGMYRQAPELDNPVAVTEAAVWAADRAAALIEALDDRVRQRAKEIKKEGSSSLAAESAVARTTATEGPDGI